MTNTDSPAQRIRDALHKCVDPELGIDIVNLGLLYDVQAGDQEVHVLMTLTTPGCPLTPYFQRRITELVHGVVPEVPVRIEFTFDPPWTPEKMTPEGRRTLTMLRS